MAKPKLDTISSYIEKLNDPGVTFISAINQGLVFPGLYTAQQKLQVLGIEPKKAYDSYKNMTKTPTNYMTMRKNNDTTT